MSAENEPNTFLVIPGGEPPDPVKVFESELALQALQERIAARLEPYVEALRVKCRTLDRSLIRRVPTLTPWRAAHRRARWQYRIRIDHRIHWYLFELEFIQTRDIIRPVHLALSFTDQEGDLERFSFNDPMLFLDFLGKDVAYVSISSDALEYFDRASVRRLSDLFLEDGERLYFFLAGTPFLCCTARITEYSGELRKDFEGPLFLLEFDPAANSFEPASSGDATRLLQQSDDLRPLARNLSRYDPQITLDRAVTADEFISLLRTALQVIPTSTVDLS